LLISSYFTTCPDGGGEKLKIKLNSAQLELDLGLSLATLIKMFLPVGALREDILLVCFMFQSM
jgi:hypothetical protein